MQHFAPGLRTCAEPVSRSCASNYAAHLRAWTEGRSWLNVLMFSALFVLFGVAAVFLLDRLERRPSSNRRGIALILYAPPLAAGSLVAVPTLGFYFSPDFCSCVDPPVLVGASLLLAGVATGWASIAAIRGTQPEPRLAARLLGWAGVCGAFVAGSFTTAREFTAIL